MWFALAVALAAQQTPSKTAAIPRVEAKIVVDGDLNEAVWQQAARLTDFRQYEPSDGRPAEERTEVLVWYAPDAIHFGIIAYDREPQSIRATRADRDKISGEDHVMIFLDTFNDRRRAFFFGVNPLGVQQDGVRTEGAGSAGRSFGGNTDTNPDYIFDSRGRLTDTGYTVEVRIPFKSLRFQGSGPQSWGLQLQRVNQRTGYTDTWTDVSKASASFLVQTGQITGLHDLVRGVVIEAQPFITTTANGARDSGTSRFVREDVNPDAGANLRIGFTNIAIDATVNPDFSQVESDASQVTINERFALFIPEKRPFFLEGIELFNVPSQLVYTRQVVDPIAGGKVTGKVGPFGIAHLTAADQDVNAAGNEALFNITRLRTDFGRNSLAGLLYTDRTVLGSSDYNRVLSGDARVVFKQLYFAEAQLAHSWTRDEASTTCGTDESCGGAIWKLTVDRTGRNYGFNYAIDGIEQDFTTRSGFVNRRNIATAHAFNRLSWYGKPGARLEAVRLFVTPTWRWTYDGFLQDAPLEGTVGADINYRLRGGWSIDTNVGHAFVRLDSLEYGLVRIGSLTGPALRPHHLVEGLDYELRVTTPTFQRFDASITLGTGHVPLFDEGAAGRTLRSVGRIALRPTTRLRINADGGVTRLIRARDESFFARASLARLSTEYQLTRAIFFRAIGDAQFEQRSALRDPFSERPLVSQFRRTSELRDNELRVDLLASYEPSPGTVAFFGYGTSLAGTPELEDLRRNQDGFFLKVAYLFRR